MFFYNYFYSEPTPNAQEEIETAKEEIKESFIEEGWNPRSHLNESFTPDSGE